MIIFNYRRNYLVILVAFFIINTCLSLRLHKVSLVNRRAECMKLNVISPRVIGGVLSGGLHAITGPDHLAALLPTSIGKSGFYGLRIGALWGFGHGISAMLLGLGAFFLKGKMSSRFEILEKLSSLAESIVGASLILIGLTGIKESFDSQDSSIEKTGSEETTDSSSFLKSSKAIFVNGILHGFSLDGAPSLLPAIAMSSWRSSMTFLVSYCFGTMLTMSITSGVVAELSSRLGRATNNPNLPKNLSLASSLVAIAIGVFWISQAAFAGR